MHERFLNDLSKAKGKISAVELAKICIQEKAKLNAVVDLSLVEENTIHKKAVYVLLQIDTIDSKILAPYTSQFINALLDSTLKIPQKRNLFRVLQSKSKDYIRHAELFTYCQQISTNTKESIAVRAFSMKVMANIAEEFPELRREFKLILEEIRVQPKASAGILSRVKRLGKLFK